MPAAHPEFSDHALTRLLAALHARTSAHPDNPGLIACWPVVREDRMAAACAELRRRGHPVFRIWVDSAKAGEMRTTWAVAAMADDPVGPL